MKICSTCKITKEKIEFNVDSRSKSGLTGRCKDCHQVANSSWYEKNKEKAALNTKKQNLKRNYGISLEEYNIRLENQNGVCYICKTKKDGSRALHVDHNHETGQIRGLLCSPCNMAIGLFKDNINTLLSAINYLGLYETKKEET